LKKIGIKLNAKPSRGGYGRAEPVKVKENVKINFALKQAMKTQKGE
jgi:hypothetical protein